MEKLISQNVDQTFVDLSEVEVQLQIADATFHFLDLDIKASENKIESASSRLEETPLTDLLMRRTLYDLLSKYPGLLTTIDKFSKAVV